MGDKNYSKYNYKLIFNKSNILEVKNGKAHFKFNFLKFIINIAIHHSNIEKYDFNFYNAKIIILNLVNKSSKVKDNLFIDTINSEIEEIKEEGLINNYILKNIFKQIINRNKNIHKNRKLFFFHLDNLLKNYIIEKSIIKNILDKNLYNYILNENLKNKSNDFLNLNLEYYYNNSKHEIIYIKKQLDDKINQFFKFKKINGIPVFSKFIPLIPYKINGLKSTFFRDLYSYIYIISSNSNLEKKNWYKKFDLPFDKINIIMELFNELKNKNQLGGRYFDFDNFMNVYINNDINELKKINFNKLNLENIKFNKKNKILYKVFLEKINKNKNNNFYFNDNYIKLINL